MRNKFNGCNSHWRLIRHLRTEGWVIANPPTGPVKTDEAQTLVFISPCKAKALRVNHGDYRGFGLYVDVARAVPQNPYLQNIGHDFFLDDGTYCVELEPLMEMNHPAVGIKVKGEKAILNQLLNWPFRFQSTPDFITRTLKRNPKFKEAMEVSFTFLKSASQQDIGFRRDLDVHSGNFMVQNLGSTQDLVLIDLFEHSADAKIAHDIAETILWHRKLGIPEDRNHHQLAQGGMGYGIILPRFGNLEAI